MLNNYAVLAGFNAVVWSLVLIFYRLVMSKGADARTLVIFIQLYATAFLICCFGLPDYLSYERSMLYLLVASGLLWAFGVFLEIAALEYIEATASRIIAAARYVLSFCVGIFVLGEPLSLLRVSGVLLIIFSILGISRFHLLTFRKGFWLTLASVFLQVSAYAIDKNLAEVLPATSIVISSFFFPGFTFLLIYPRNLIKIREEIIRSKGILIVIPIALALAYLAIVKAFGVGEFVSVMAIAESTLIFTALFAYLFLNERDQPMRKAVCSIACAIGVILVCVK